MAATFAVKSIDHVVLTCRNIPATIAFYKTKLGMKHEVFTSMGIERSSFYATTAATISLIDLTETPFALAGRSSISTSRAKSSSPRPAPSNPEAKTFASSLIILLTKC